MHREIKKKRGEKMSQSDGHYNGGDYPTASSVGGGNRPQTGGPTEGGDDISSNEGQANASASGIRVGISGMDGTISQSEMSMTNIPVSVSARLLNNRSETAMTNLRAAIEADIGNIESLAQRFGEFDAAIGAKHLLTDILHN